MYMTLLFSIKNVILLFVIMLKIRIYNGNIGNKKDV